MNYMFDKRIYDLIKKVNACPRDAETNKIMTDNEIDELYKEVQNLINDENISKEYKEKIKNECQLEKLTMLSSYS